MRALCALLLLGSVATAVHAASQNASAPYHESCINTLDDSFFNKCRRESPPGFLAAVGRTVTTWLNPTATAVYVAILILVLPIVVITHRKLPASAVPEAMCSYKSMHLHLVNLLHRIACYTLVLNVALYAIFRQHRPCECREHATDRITQVGSIYGMPSGDAMSGAVVGCTVIMWSPLGRTWSVVVGILIMFFKALERLVLGLHSIGQVTTGITIGCVLSIYSMNAPQFMMFFDSAVSIITGIISLGLDSELRFTRDDSNNIVSWFLWGISADMIALMLLARFFFHFPLGGPDRRRWEGMKRSLRAWTSILASERDIAQTDGRDYRGDSARRPPSYPRESGGDGVGGAGGKIERVGAEAASESDFTYGQAQATAEGGPEKAREASITVPLLDDDDLSPTRIKHTLDRLSDIRFTWIAWLAAIPVALFAYCFQTFDIGYSPY